MWFEPQGKLGIFSTLLLLCWQGFRDWLTAIRGTTAAAARNQIFISRVQGAYIAYWWHGNGHGLHTLHILHIFFIFFPYFAYWKCCILVWLSAYFWIFFGIFFLDIFSLFCIISIFFCIFIIIFAFFVHIHLHIQHMFCILSTLFSYLLHLLCIFFAYYAFVFAYFSYFLLAGLQAKPVWCSN